MSGEPNTPLPPPSLEDELRRLIATHGREAVKATATQLTKRPRGRTPLGDWKLLAPDLRQDAANWLTGQARATHYAIAKRFAEQHPGHSVPATVHRIQVKLAKGRERWMLSHALSLTMLTPETRAQNGIETTRYPFAAYLRTMEALAEAEPDRGWREWLEQERLTVEHYREIYGEPDASMTWAELREKAVHPANALAALSATPKASGGMMFRAGRRESK